MSGRICCEEGVFRRGEYQPCERPAIAIRNDPEFGVPYPVCRGHIRGDMVRLEDAPRLIAEHGWRSA